jgi:hypothetical protein
LGLSAAGLRPKLSEFKCQRSRRAGDIGIFQTKRIDTGNKAITDAKVSPPERHDVQFDAGRRFQNKEAIEIILIFVDAFNIFFGIIYRAAADNEAIINDPAKPPAIELLYREITSPLRPGRSRQSLS